SDPDSGQAVAVDPLRDIGQYLDQADQLQVRITHALETHVHNDFVSGARELQVEAGSEVGAAEDARLEFKHLPLREGSEIPLGRWRLRARHTPGHTPDHLSYLLVGPDDHQEAIFSGGALMVGAIARTDLFGPHLATHLALEAFKTLHLRLRHRPDDLAVYPTHGTGPFSAWVGWVVERGRPIVLAGGTDRQHQKAHKQLLRIGYDSVVGWLDGGIDAWSASGRELTSFETAEVADLATWILSAEPMTVIDARNEDEWVHGHVPGAVRMPVPDISHHAHELPREAPVAVHCGVGYRAAIAAS